MVDYEAPQMTAVYGIIEPYRVAKVFMPMDAMQVNVAPLSDETRIRVARLTSTLRETLRQLQQYLLPIMSLRQQIIVIRAIIKEIYEETLPALQELASEYNLNTNRAVQEQYLSPDDLHHLGGYIVYDEYFSTIRVPGMTAPQLLCQSSAIVYELLGDLPFTMLAREEIEMLFTAIYKLFACFVEEASSTVPPVPASYVLNERNQLEAIEYLWTTMATDDSQRKNIAMFRWLVGHHMYNMITVFLTRSVELAMQAIDTGDEQVAGFHFDRASTFLRAGVSCEWYAANFSSDVYGEIVRPSMQMQDVPGGDGFSGDQNAEFNRFKVTKERLKTVLREHSDTLSPMLQNMVRQFVEMYVQDGEHHILLASAMTGNGPSISQEEWMKDLPDGTPMQSAVDFLRNMVTARRGEFSKKRKEGEAPILEPTKPMELPDDLTIVCTTDDLNETQLIMREINGKKYLIGRTNGQYWASSAICTHKRFRLSKELDANDNLICPKHGAQFEPITGRVVQGPTGTSDLAMFEVVNDNGVLKVRGLKDNDSQTEATDA